MYRYITLHILGFILRFYFSGSFSFISVSRGENSASVPTPTAKQSGFKQLKTAFSDWYKSRHISTPTASTPANDADLQVSTLIDKPVEDKPDDDKPVEDIEAKNENELFASITWNSTPDSTSSGRFSSSHENRHISLGKSLLSCKILYSFLIIYYWYFCRVY